MNVARRLPRPSSFLFRTLRPLATVPHRSPTISGLLSAATAANPLKDAVKFIATPKSTIWTYRELHSHVSALAAGLHELDYSGHTILSLLPPGSPEYPVLLLAAAHVGAKIIPIPPPSDPNALNVQILRDALNEHRPSALFIAKEYDVSNETEDDGIIASINPILQALDPAVALEDAAGTHGFVPLTGRPFRSRKFPFLKHVVTTSDTNMRGTITFKSLLLYNNDSPDSGDSSAPLLAAKGIEVSEEDIIAQAQSLGKKLGLSSDHMAREGKIVVKPEISQSSTAALVAAVMHEALLVSPGEQDAAEVSSSENALLA